MAPAVDAMRVRRVAEIAELLGAIRLRERARRFEERIRASRIYVACVGEVKRGKSSLLNAILGEPLLPMGIIPVTAIPIVVRHGERYELRVRFSSGFAEDRDIAEIRKFAEESLNPGNVRGVETIEIFAPVELLSSGLSLIDTPGLGSVAPGASAITTGIVPQIDAAIVVIGVDPPLSGEELDLIAKVAASVKRMIVVMNKVDRFSTEERDAARSFAHDVISERTGRSPGKILEVSAVERLSGIPPDNDWTSLLVQVQQLVAEQRASVLEEALHRGAERLVAEALAEVSAIARNVYQPVVDADDRLEKLRSVIAGTAFDWLMLHQQIERLTSRAEKALEARRTSFLVDARGRAGTELADAAKTVDVRERTQYRAALYAHAVSAANHELQAWARTEITTAERVEGEFAATVLEAARDALNKVGALRPDEWGVDLTTIDPVSGNAGTLDEMLVATMAESKVNAQSLLTRSFESLLSQTEFRNSILSEVRMAAERILDDGSEKIIVRLVARLKLIGEQIEAQLRTAVDDVFARADGAVTALSLIRNGEETVARKELERLAGIRHEIIALRHSSGATD